MRGICRKPAFSSHFSLWNSDRITVARFFRRPFFRFHGSFSGLGTPEFRSFSGGFRSLCRVFVQLVYIIRSFVQFAYFSMETCHPSRFFIHAHSTDFCVLPYFPHLFCAVWSELLVRNRSELYIRKFTNSSQKNWHSLLTSAKNGGITYSQEGKRSGTKVPGFLISPLRHIP